MNMLKFDTLITPTIVKWIFYLGVVVSMLTGLVPVLTAKYMGAFGFEVDMTAAVLVGCLLALIGILTSRVAAEMVLVIFMIRDELAWQRERQER